MDTNTNTNIAKTIINAGFDISLLQQDTSALFKTHITSVLFDKDGNHAAGFEIVGKNSDQYQDVIRATSTTAIKRSVTKSQQIDATTDEGAGALYDLGVDRNMKIAMAVVVGLPGFTDKGQPAAVTGEFLKAVFTTFPTWQDKILADLEAEANFLKI